MHATWRTSQPLSVQDLGSPSPPCLGVDRAEYIDLLYWALKVGWTAISCAGPGAALGGCSLDVRARTWVHHSSLWTCAHRSHFRIETFKVITDGVKYLRAVSLTDTGFCMDSKPAKCDSKNRKG